MLKTLYRVAVIVAMIVGIILSAFFIVYGFNTRYGLKYPLEYQLDLFKEDKNTLGELFDHRAAYYKYFSKLEANEHEADIFWDLNETKREDDAFNDLSKEEQQLLDKWATEQKRNEKRPWVESLSNIPEERVATTGRYYLNRNVDFVRGGVPAATILVVGFLLLYIVEKSPKQ